MSDDYNDYLYEKRKDTWLNRVHDLMEENERLLNIITFVCKKGISGPAGDLRISDYACERLYDALQEDE